VTLEAGTLATSDASDGSGLSKIEKTATPTSDKASAVATGFAPVVMVSAGLVSEPHDFVTVTLWPAPESPTFNFLVLLTLQECTSMSRSFRRADTSQCRRRFFFHSMIGVTKST
jgi:hypothetical protein